jgi:hypothetical protein
LIDTYSEGQEKAQAHVSIVSLRLFVDEFSLFGFRVTVSTHEKD